MVKRSAAMLVYRFDHDGDLEVLIAHMGGPLWARKEEHAWSIPKGLFEPGEDALAAALREFREEMGSPAPEGPYLELGDTKQSSGKVITTFAVHGEHDVSTFSSNLFEMEWPRGSGKMQWFPEMDRAAWFDLPTAATKLVKGQLPILDALSAAVRRPLELDL
ncbi:NUDIX domain-containing protein [Kineosporia babensis]|uniref:NUDIX domain-containing protein n=1 Tax=Kineosporia babensis TaxID=499548 RepID=A0A9X1NAL8_9ACTN|nr:NUDIX domain-containing protein [Kineosporia babensis]